MLLQTGFIGYTHNIKRSFQTVKHYQYVMTFALLLAAVATVHCIVSFRTSPDQVLLWECKPVS